MKYERIFLVNLLMASAFIACKREKANTDYSGTYCVNSRNMEMTLTQTGNEVTFTVQGDLLVNGTGKITGDTLFLEADDPGAKEFTSHITFSENGQLFSGPFQVKDTNGIIAVEGIMLGIKGACATYDIETNGIPEFIGKDFTQLSKIEIISMFRSGFGHSATDGSELC